MSDTESYVTLRYGPPRASLEYIKCLPKEVIRKTLAEAWLFQPAELDSVAAGMLLFSMLLHPADLNRASPIITRLLAEYHERN